MLDKVVVHSETQVIGDSEGGVRDASSKVPFAKTTVYQNDSFGYRNWRQMMNTPVGDLVDRTAVELSRRSGFWIDWEPRSRYEVSKLYESLLPYFEPAKCHFAGEILRQAISSVRDKLVGVKMVGVKPITLDQSAARAIADERFDSASGAPFFSHKGEVVEDTLKRAKCVLKGRFAPAPAVAYYRTQVKKVRLVWAVPFEMIMIEGMYGYPLIDALSAVSTPYVIGHSRSWLQTAVQGSSSTTGGWWSVDFSKFDSSLPPVLTHAAFDLLREIIPGEEPVWSLITRYFHTCPIVMPDGLLYKGRRKGVPSGSLFTQIIDSLCNMIVIEYLALRMKLRIKRYFVYGDDAIVRLSLRPDFSTAASVVDELGLKINLEKQYFSRDPHFLGHHFSASNLSWRRDAGEVLNRFCFPERPKNLLYPERIARAIQYLIESPNDRDLWRVIGQYVNLLTHGEPGFPTEPGVVWYTLKDYTRSAKRKYALSNVPFVREVLKNPNAPVYYLTHLASVSGW